MLGDVHERADAPHRHGLLRPRSKRPPGSRSAEQPDEFAPPHCPAHNSSATVRFLTASNMNPLCYRSQKVSLVTPRTASLLCVMSGDSAMSTLHPRILVLMRKADGQPALKKSTI